MCCIRWKIGKHGRWKLKNTVFFSSAEQMNSFKKSLIDEIGETGKEFTIRCWYDLPDPV